MAQTQINGATQIRSASVTADRLVSASITDTQLAASYIKANGSVAHTAAQSMGGFKLTSVGDPTVASDAATKSYVDALLQGFDWKASVRVATTANGVLASAYANASVVDGVTLATGDRILIKNQTTGSENGIYTVNATGAPTRATDADVSADMTAGVTAFVSEGTANGNSSWTLTTDDPIVLGTSAVVFTQVAGGSLYAAGAGLTLTGQTFDVVAADTTLTVNADSVQVRLADASLEVSSGLRVKQGTSGQVYIANASGVLTPVTLSGDATVTAGGVLSLTATVMKSTNYIVRETPTGLVNGTNVTFALANTPVSGSESVFLNGILQEPGAGNDYTIATSTITYLTAPVTGDKIRVSYIK